MARLKIALVHAFSWPEVRRGGERLVHELNEYLRGDGHVVDVFSGTTSESQYHMSPEGRTFRLRIPWMRALEGYGLTKVEMFGVRTMVPLVLHRYDVVHAFTPTAVLAAILAGQRTIYTILGHPTKDSLPERRFQRAGLKRAVTAATEVVALSRSAAEAAEAAFGRTPQIVSPGIWWRSYEPDPDERSPTVRVLFSGDLGNRDKGLPVLLAAFDHVLARYPGARLALSGPGRAEWALREITATARQRIEDAIEFLGTGALDEVPERYRSAHVTVLPSRDEAFGIALVESLACGTPVVGGSPGGAEDIITDNVGRIVAYGDVDALATAIDECIRLSREPGTAARCHEHAARWDWSVVGPRYVELYTSVASERPMDPLLGVRRLTRAERAPRSAEHPTPR